MNISINSIFEVFKKPNLIAIVSNKFSYVHLNKSLIPFDHRFEILTVDGRCYDNLYNTRDIKDVLPMLLRTKQLSQIEIKNATGIFINLNSGDLLYEKMSMDNWYVLKLRGVNENRHVLSFVTNEIRAHFDIEKELSMYNKLWSSKLHD